MKKRIEYEQKTSLNSDWVRKQMAHFMEEDVPNGDLTTEAIVAASTLVIAQINSGEDFIFCGSSVIPYCFPEFGGNVGDYYRICQ
jgi:nicotinate-nucleotide pyrophosphorylase